MHLAFASVLVVGVPLAVVRGFLPAGAEEDADGAAAPGRQAWTEPRTLAIGLMVLSMALTEGVASDWLAVALVDRYAVPAWLGASGFALFVAAMTSGR